MRNKMIQNIYRVVPAALLAGTILLAGCEQQDVEHLASVSSDINISDKLATLNISLQATPEYNAPVGETRSAGNSGPLIAEWAKVNTFDATQPVDKSGEAATDDESEGPRIALMELSEDTVSNTPRTRSTMPAGIYFRLIAFRKSGGGYVFQSAADYTSNGSSAPVLQQGKMNLPINQVYRFVAYSFNNNASLGTLPLSYTWNNSQILIPNLYNDFLTYDSGDRTPSGESLALAVSFTHQLCQLTVRINPIDFVNNGFTNCTGVYISQGGNSSSWTVGQDGIAANTNNSPSFNINDNSTATIRLVPFAYPHPVSVHFGTLTVGGIAANNLTITSTQAVQLVRGRSYTMTTQIKYNPPGIMVPESEINLTTNGCTQQDKADLSRLRWAEGNLKSTGNGTANDYEWAVPTDPGYYYTFLSTYTGNTTTNGIDPCTKLNPSKYGSGWRTPSKNELEKLSRCTDLAVYTVQGSGKHGMKFLNAIKGISLTGGLIRDFEHGSGTDVAPGWYVFENAGYWSSESVNSTTGHAMIVVYGKVGMKSGYVVANKSASVGTLYWSCGIHVRCVLGVKQ